MAIPITVEQLKHIVTAIMMGIHDFFSGLEIEGSDSISEKNLKIKGVGNFALLKDILGFDFNSNKKTIQLEEINGTNCLLS